MTADFFGASTKVLTVAELTRTIRSLLEARVGSVWVQGEVSNYKRHASGHQYFTLKDARAQIPCVIFRDAAVSLRQPLADGAQVQVYGSVTVFEARGQYQLTVEIVQPRGLGLLQAKFEALKRKLEAAGLFDATRKKQLPKFPKRIGIVTSAGGAAIRDILNVLRRRAPAVEVLINPVRVQGIGAAAEIASAINELNQTNRTWQALDLILIARGGGSIEDLWEFNEEIVARAIAASRLPTVSAIGHEIDFTIADFVADLRAPTPSAAAELIVPDRTELQRRIGELRSCLQRCLRIFVEREKARLAHLSERTISRALLQRMHESQQRFDWLAERLRGNTIQSIGDARQQLAQFTAALRRQDPTRELALRRARHDDLARRLSACAVASMQDVRTRLHRVEGLLAVLGPEATLHRGYSITTDTSGNIIRSVQNVSRGMRLHTRLGDGTIKSDVV